MDKFILFNRAKAVGFVPQFIGEHPISIDDKKEELRYFLLICEIGYWANSKLGIEDSVEGTSDIEKGVDGLIKKLEANETID